jgi:O-methyltransferase
VSDPADLYIELLKKSLTHSLYKGADALGYRSRNPLKRWLVGAMRRRNVAAVRILEDHEEKRSVGEYWPMFAQTMIGKQRLDSLHECIDTVLREGVPGDLIETGVWRGGATIFMRGLLEVRGVTDRIVFAADSFEGLPPPKPDVYAADADATYHLEEELAVSLEEVKDNFRRYGLLDEQVSFLKGWFKDTLPTLGDRRFALARLDGDMYESTIDALTNLYPRLSRGGFLIIDDYSIDECREAVTDYRRDNRISEELQEVDWSGVFWRKGDEPSSIADSTKSAGAASQR